MWHWSLNGNEESYTPGSYKILMRLHTGVGVCAETWLRRKTLCTRREWNLHQWEADPTELHPHSYYLSLVDPEGPINSQGLKVPEWWGQRHGILAAAQPHCSEPTEWAWARWRWPWREGFESAGVGLHAQWKWRRWRRPRRQMLWKLQLYVAGSCFLQQG